MVPTPRTGQLATRKTTDNRQLSSQPGVLLVDVRSADPVQGDITATAILLMRISPDLRSVKTVRAPKTHRNAHHLFAAVRKRRRRS